MMGSYVCVKQDQRYLDFANDILDSGYTTLNSKCISKIRNDGKILIAVVFDRFSKNYCEMGAASVDPRACTRDFLDAVFHFPFITCKRTRVTTIVHEDNAKSLKLHKGLGFIEEARLKGACGDKDGILFRMLKSECRWLRGDK